MTAEVEGAAREEELPENTVDGRGDILRKSANLPKLAWLLCTIQDVSSGVGIRVSMRLNI